MLANLLVEDDPSPPTNDFSTTPLGPHTIFYLAITTPHTDTYVLHGPVTSFSHLLPTIKSTVSDSPSAIDKLDALSSTTDVWGAPTPNKAFSERGFTTFVVNGQRGTFTLLEVLREENKPVFDTLLAPVYTVSAHGPLAHTPDYLGRVGVAETSKLVGSFVRRDEAKEAAGKAMEELVKGEVGVKRSEHWGRERSGLGVGGGVLMAMNGEGRWEVRVAYEEEVMKRVREGSEMRGERVGWRI
ncbi:hypothetical protein DE146DRAFT_770089 [Phaeosphaeria sp. MPI-PUGE-AT-0046c]|nr:hypothetical protein DE146DRAFT_770089 [Phaeosphaeria sp. MPI-PUGE-AT-0046c]